MSEGVINASIRHINAISLNVADDARSASFYPRVFKANVIENGPDNIVVKLDGILLNLLDMKLAYAPTSPDRCVLPLEINIWLDDVDAIYKQLLDRGVTFLAPPADQPWGIRNITFFDPDGHRFEMAQPISD